MSGFPVATMVFGEAFREHVRVVEAASAQRAVLEQIAAVLAAAIANGRKILWCGNGGSAADAQHLAAEIVGRFKRNRRGLPSIALTTDTSILTAVANDFGYDAVFSRQIEALGERGDVLVGISTSGNSENVVKAFEQARALGVTTVAFTGEGGGRMASLADYLFAVPAKETARVQEVHILAGHALCDWVEASATATEQARVEVA